MYLRQWLNKFRSSKWTWKPCLATSSSLCTGFSGCTSNCKYIGFRNHLNSSLQPRHLDGVWLRIAKKFPSLRGLPCQKWWLSVKWCQRASRVDPVPWERDRSRPPANISRPNYTIVFGCSASNCVSVDERNEKMGSGSPPLGSKGVVDRRNLPSSRWVTFQKLTDMRQIRKSVQFKGRCEKNYPPPL